MTDYVELLNRMSSTFNSDCATSTAEGGTLLNLDLAEDKTVKWRNLANNQFACKDKDKKQCHKSDTEAHEKQQEAPPQQQQQQQLLLVDASVKCETEAAAATAAGTVPQGQSQSADVNVDVNCVSAEITEKAASAATATVGEAQAKADAAAPSSATTPNEATAADSKNSKDDDVTEQVAEAAVEATPTVEAAAEGVDNAAVTTKVAAITTTTAAAENKEKDTEVKLEQEACKSAADSETIITTTVAAELATQSVQILTAAARAAEAEVEAATNTGEGIKTEETETETETATTTPKEEPLVEEQQQSLLFEQTSTEQREASADAAAATAAPTPTAELADAETEAEQKAEVKSLPVAASSASAQASPAPAAPLVVNSAAISSSSDNVDAAADATDLTLMNSAASDYGAAPIAAITTTQAAAAQVSADKNEQYAAGSTRRLRRTPRPMDTPTTTPTPAGADEPSPEREREHEQESPPDSSQQQLAPPANTEASGDVKKEPEKSPGAGSGGSSLDSETPAATAPAAPKRGRGRAKKIKPETDAAQEPTSTTGIEALMPGGQEEATAPAVERKVGRKRKLAEEEPLAELPPLVIKTEQQEEEAAAAAAAAPSSEAKMRMRRSVRLGNRVDQAPHAWPDDVKVEPAAEPPPPLVPESQPMASLLDEKTPPKKRGRKAKIVTPASRGDAPGAVPVAATTTSSSNSSSGSNVATLSNGNKRAAAATPLPIGVAGGSGELQLPKRSKRRIKPTPKILENDELRCEFETKHIERMTHWEAAAAGDCDGAQFETPLQSCSGHSTASRQKSDKSTDGGGFDQQQHPAGTCAIKKRLFAKSQRDIDNSRAALRAKSLLRPCPDVEQFLGDIKAAKLNANRSPEERKLNKKQLRKLAKQKEKHLKHLGLRRNNSEEASDNDSSNTDNEEFVPPTRVQVGKPSVTLRLRNASKESQSSSNHSSAQKPTQAQTLAPFPLPPSLASIGQSKLSRRVGVRSANAAAAAAAAAAGATTLEHGQLHTLNSAILAANDAGDAVASTSAAAAAAAASAKFICLCQKGSQYYARNAPDSSYCCAIDNIDEQKIGCCNELAAEVHNLLRPSQRVGYMILCDEHKKRLQAHNCCAGCGIFCTQGKFVLCKQQHFFHPDCAQRFILNSPYDPQQMSNPGGPVGNYASPLLVLKCPHCGLDTPERTSTVTMKCQTLPVFLPAQKTKIKPAKLTTASQLVQFGNVSSGGGNAAGGSKPPGAAGGGSSSSAKSTAAAGRAKAAGGGSYSVAKSNGTRGKTNAANAANQPLNIINFEQLIPESVMNVVLRNRIVSSSGRVTTEFNSRDMYYAVQNDDLERVAEILAADYNVLTRMREFLNGTCLHLVAHSGTLQMAYLLLCKGASSQDFVNIVDSELRTALMCAVMNDKCDMLNLFLQCGADVAIKGPDGMTSLHIAAKLGNLEAAQLIVDSYRASRNIANFLCFINVQDEGGWTAMVWAAELGHTDIVSLLINHGANPNICDNDNNTVLHWSTLHNDGLETITVLLRAGADCNVQNVEGDTPLHIACRHSVTRMCIALIANGADLMIKNKAEQLPFDCIPNEESECGRTVGFNMQMRSFRPLGLRTRVVCADASNGRELRPIQAVRNELTMSEHEDEADALMWPDFKYINNCIILQNSVQIDRRVSQMRICSCLDSCSSDLCQCNGASSQNWYTAESRLNCDFNYDDPAVIFECNDVCGCNQLSCKNRVVQNGTRTPLQIVECEEPAKGWGVRALANVPKGTFVASYTGEILTAPEADRRTDDSYYFDLDNGHCIDANYYGNISRFFNHSCEPNILPVRVFYEHQDYRFPKIAFFACRDIDAGEEICYDYGEKFWRAEQRTSGVPGGGGVGGSGCKCLTASCKYALNSPSSNASPTPAVGLEEAAPPTQKHYLDPLE